MEDSLVDLHSKVLDRLLNEREAKPDFTFATRVRNNDERLNHGYWFQGNENYIFVPLFSVGDDNNMTKTIGFVITEHTQHIEVVYGNINKKIDNELDFYRELTEYLSTMRNLTRQDIGANKHYFVFNNDDLESNLNFYINEFRDTALELLKKYHLTDKYLIDEDTFRKNMDKINNYKKKRLDESGLKIAVEKNKNQSKDNIGIKNIILYGSPGVGKTHNTNKLIRLIEDSKSDSEIFEAIRQNDKSEHMDIGDIRDRVKFITFHQSFGYEDFIEGFRPNEEGNIGLEKGIFLEICKEAEENLLQSSEQGKVSFREAFNRLFKEKIENEESIKIDLKRTGSYFKVNDFNDKTIYFEKQSGTTKHTLSLASLEKMYDAEKNDLINGGLAVYYEPILEKLLEIKKEIRVKTVERKNYYLVIDEINRGNISKIFGELITLIEEDKRDNLEVTLPYSKMPFRIPSNLYIIGTMNSTDKSIALIDIALRRRFTFLKMEPNSELIEYPRAKTIFESLNDKVTETLGEDYQLGHSYFMNIQNDDDLSFILEYKIKPLLEEYYYGDKSGLEDALSVLGDISSQNKETAKNGVLEPK